ncbi:MAG: T9SS type A sorting domain-containing protein [Bacteroidetes bacterium]|nr:T9SS type A sorting domain-containing protein [Bacteroidota bacterium]
MKTAKLILVISLLLALGFGVNRAVNNRNTQEQVDTRIDNQGYWKRVARKGLVPYNPDVKVKEAIYTGSTIRAHTVSTLDSPDVPVTEISSVQSENSVFINPLDETNLLNSNNSTNGTVDIIYGANALFSFNSSTNWEGNIEGAGEDNGGDPAAVIGLNGRWYVNYINNNGGLSVSYSDDQGISWVVNNATPNPSIIVDKNHMWIDNNPDSPFEGNLYVAWTNFSDFNLGEIGFSYSTDDGETWTIIGSISSDVNAGSHNQGVNLSTGPNGEVYAVWAIYDNWLSGGSDEVAIGMALSHDGGATWEPSKRIISNIRGIRASRTSKNMRVNSFPVSTVDNSNSADKGSIYVTWANIGIPGINTGEDIDIYLIKSIDYGDSWTEPIRVNQDVLGQGKEHYLPWICCDPTHGILSMIYYDDRNVNSNQCEVYCANSVDGGFSWDEFKVSDVSFTPAPIPGLADSYMGDYLGIHAKNGMVYPIWTDNRAGYAMSYCSPYQTNPVNRPFELSGDIVFETGESQLMWSYESTPEFMEFIIYRDGDSIASTVDTSFIEILPDYGVYRYRVTAYYSDGIESGASGIALQWGNVIISTNPDSISDHLAKGNTSEKQILVINQGQLDLHYSISLNSSLSKSRDYCNATGNSGVGQEYISGVEVGEIINLGTGNDNYTDYTNMSTTMKVGESYEITVTNGNPYDLDQCATWIDWSGDEIFDENEITVLESIPGTEFFVGLISPPPGAVSGTTKMRVRLTYTGNLNPCGETNFGEVEDYTVFVQGWVDIFPRSDTINPGDSSIVTIVFNAIDLPEGDYSTNANIFSNDPESGINQITLSLRVDHLIVRANAIPNEVCPGKLIVLQAQVSGIFDSISYNWASNPIGYVSEKARPFAIPLVPTWYIAQINDGDHMSIDSVFVTTLPTPQINLGADTSLCASKTIILNAGNPGLSYLWSNGDTTQTIFVDTTGFGHGIQNHLVEVTNLLGCSETDDIEVDFVNCTGIFEMESVSINIYPNPNKGKFQIDFSNKLSENSDLRIVNSTGDIVYQKSNADLVNSRKIYVDIENLESGYYTAILLLKGHKISKRIIMIE